MMVGLNYGKEREGYVFMIYMGSKARIAKDILPIMLKDIGDNYFVDCFCGGGNLIQFVLKQMMIIL